MARRRSDEVVSHPVAVARLLETGQLDVTGRSEAPVVKTGEPPVIAVAALVDTQPPEKCALGHETPAGFRFCPDSRPGHGRARPGRQGLAGGRTA